MGYAALQVRHNFPCLPCHVESFAHNGARRTIESGPHSVELYPDKYWPGDSDWDHLEFALKHEGLNLPFLRAYLTLVATTELTAYINARPASQFRRRLWFLFEEITGTRLPVADAATGNYIDLLDEQSYYTGSRLRSQRHRVNNNLPGTTAFSPMVRKTKTLLQFEAKQLDKACQKTIKSIPPELYSRALDFLFIKETKSSYAIERETPDQKRANRFVDLLREAGRSDFLNEQALVNLQKAIVDPRFALSGWKTQQNYVGESRLIGEHLIHFIPPRPEETPALMRDYIQAAHRILQSDIHPVIAAAMIAYTFVFLHPFDDGNGRVHRFLLHHVLAQRGFAPEGVIFPISATMLHRPRDYDQSLEAFSKPLQPLIDYDLSPEGRLTVLNDTSTHYRYIDLTTTAEILFSFVQETIEKELPAEVSYLQQYDDARARMRQIVDLPNRNADLFIRFTIQNNGRLAKNRRKEFSTLTDREIAALESSIRTAFNLSQTP